jgi:5'-3' exonuclease
MKALIDGDGLAFRAASAPNVQKHRWQYQHKDGSVELFPGLDKRRIVKKILENPAVYEGGNLQHTTVMIGTLQNATLNARDMMKHILGTLRTHDYLLYLGNRGVPDFRRQMAKLIPYKQSREKQPTPVFLTKVHEYLIKHWGAIVVKDCQINYEVDDVIVIYQCTSGEDCISVSVDKDFDQSPGDRFNPVTEQYYKNSDPGTLELVVKESSSGKKTKKLKGGGILWFYAQMLLGDAADNIPHMKGYGPITKVCPLLKGVTEEKEMFRIVYDCYKKDGNLGDTLNEYLYELADLLWIHRKPNDFKSPMIKQMIKEIENENI